MTTDKQIRFAFNGHGLGDVVHCCHAMRLYIDRGYDVQIQVEPNKRWVWEAAGIPIYDGPGQMPIHPYYYPADFFDLSRPDHTHSKIAHLFEVNVLPKLGTKEDVWRMVCNERIKATVGQQALEEATKFIVGLPKPIVLLHSKGSNWQEEKSIPDATAFHLICELIGSFDGSIVTIDWDSRSPTLGHDRVRPIKPYSGRMDTEVFAALCQFSDLLIGIDSGPFHLAGWFDIPTLFVTRRIPPVRCCLPNPNATYLVPARDHEHWQSRSESAGLLWRFAEFDGDEASVQDIVVTAFELDSIMRRKKVEAGIAIGQIPAPTPESIPGYYTYRRCGYDERPLELRPDGTIGEGSARCERTWKLTPGPFGELLVIYGDERKDTCHLRICPDGIFRGSWIRHERMPIELIPLKPSSLQRSQVVEWSDLEPVEPTLDSVQGESEL